MECRGGEYASAEAGVKLYLVRHSVPDDIDEAGLSHDDPGFDPPLTDEGRDLAQALGEQIVQVEWVPNFILASPKLRCQETAEILRDVCGLPEVRTQESMGSSMSIRKMVLKVAQDKTFTRVMMVSHHESIEHGLRVLNLEPWIHLDMFAMAELRRFEIDRKDGTWEEHDRIMPSDLGLWDRY